MRARMRAYTVGEVIFLDQVKCSLWLEFSEKISGQCRRYLEHLIK